MRALVLLVATVGGAAASHGTNTKHGRGRRLLQIRVPPPTSAVANQSSSSSASSFFVVRRNSLAIDTRSRSGSVLLSSSLRCGSASTGQRDDDDLAPNHDSGAADATNDDDEEGRRRQQQQRVEEEEEYNIKLTKYHNEQQLLYQLRSTYLLELLSSRGIPNLPTLTSVCTSESDRPPTTVDWDCALSTNDEPRGCLYSFDAEPYTKVVAPSGTHAWISLSALNRLRRTDASKVEPMWHGRYSILDGWFGENSRYCMLQHVGMKGFVVSSVLLDGGNGLILRSLLLLSAVTTLIILRPIIEYTVSRILVSTAFWSQWTMWSRILRAGFPLKLLLIQMIWKGVSSCFTLVVSTVREYIVDMECEILEECVPITVGAGIEGEDEERGYDNDNDDDDEYDYEDDDDEY